MHRVNEYNLSNLQRFFIILDERIDEIVREYISRHGSTTGEPFVWLLQVFMPKGEELEHL